MGYLCLSGQCRHLNDTKIDSEDGDQCVCVWVWVWVGGWVGGWVWLCVGVRVRVCKARS